MFEAWLPLKTPLERLMWLRRVISGGASWVWRTITGAAPLTLASAKAHAINSLTQYGLCTQASTPTPDAPVDIVCNNGALRYGALGDNLFDPNPSAITLGWYIASNNGQVTESQTNFMLSQFIPIEGDKKYVFFGRHKTSNRISSYNRIAWYSASKTYMTTANYPKDGIGAGTAPLNARYARLSCNLSGESAATGTPVTYAEIADYNWTFAQAAEEIPYEPFVGGIYADGTDEVLTVSGKNEANVEDYSLSFTNRYYVDKAIGVTLEAGVTYTFSCDIECSVTPFGISVGVGNDVVYLVDIVTKPNQTNGRIFVTFTPSATALSNYSKLYVRIPRFTEAKTGTVSVSKIQLERSSSATDYEPYVAPQTVTDIPNLFAVGDYADEVDIISGTVTRKVGLWVLNGQEAWELNSVYGETDNAFLARSAVPFVANSKKLLCSHFVNKASVQTAGNVSVGVFAGSQITFFCGKDSNINSVDAWTAFLGAQYAAGTPVIVIYQLAEETTEQTQAHSLHTSEGDNVVDVTANVSPVDLSVKYASTEVGFGFGNPNAGTEQENEGEDNE